MMTSKRLALIEKQRDDLTAFESTVREARNNREDNVRIEYSIHGVSMRELARLYAVDLRTIQRMLTGLRPADTPPPYREPVAMTPDTDGLGDLGDEIDGDGF